MIGYIQSISPYVGRPDEYDGLELLHPLNRLALAKSKETSVAGSKVPELGDPLVEHREGQPLSISLHPHAVIDDHLTKIIPLRHIPGQIIQLPYLFLFVLHKMLNLLKHVE